MKKIIIALGLALIATSGFSQTLTQFEKKKKFGYKNGKTVVVEAIYDYVDPDFKESKQLASVKLGEKEGMIDRAGNVVIPIEYDEIREYGEAFKVKKGDKYGLIDKTGKDITGIKYSAMQTHPVGDLFSVKEDGKIGLIDYAGKEIIPSKYDQIHPSGYSPGNVGQFNCTLAGVTEVFNAKGELMKDAKPVVRRDTYSTGSSSSSAKKEDKPTVMTTWTCSVCGKKEQKAKGTSSPSLSGCANGKHHKWKD